jgi:hypothetical protein
MYFNLEYFIQQTGRQTTLGLVLTKNSLNFLNLIPNIWNMPGINLRNFESCLYLYFFFLWHNSPQWARVSSIMRFLYHTQRRTTVSRTPLDEWSARRRDLSTCQHTTRTTNIHTPGGIWTHILNRRAAADQRLRPRGHRYRLVFVIQIYNCHWRYTKRLSVYYKNAWTLINFLFFYFINVAVFCVVAVGRYFILQDKSGFLLFFFFPVPPHVLCGLRGPPSWAWQKCNRLLRLGCPWGAVTLSQWCVSGDRGGCSARRGLKPKFY